MSYATQYKYSLGKPLCVCVCVCVLWVAPVKIWGSCWVFVAVQGLYLVAAGGGGLGGEPHFIMCLDFSLKWLLFWSTGSRRAGFSLCSTQAQDFWLEGLRVHQLQELWPTGLVAPRHVESSWTRDRTHVSCTGRQILIYCSTRKVQHSLKYFFQKGFHNTFQQGIQIFLWNRCPILLISLPECSPTSTVSFIPGKRRGEQRSHVLRGRRGGQFPGKASGCSRWPFSRKPSGTSPDHSLQVSSKTGCIGHVINGQKKTLEAISLNARRIKSWSQCLPGQSSPKEAH